jgi:hypothetical protein
LYVLKSAGGRKIPGPEGEVILASRDTAEHGLLDTQKWHECKVHVAENQPCRPRRTQQKRCLQPSGCRRACAAAGQQLVLSTGVYCKLEACLRNTQKARILTRDKAK